MPRRPSPDTTIAARIRDRRKARGWSMSFAASRAGLATSTWSRIERGLISADNRFTLADIAQALECPITDLVSSAAPPPPDRGLVAAQTNVYAIREALLEADLDERPLVPAPSLAELERETELVGDLRSRCDYAGASRRLPDLIRGLHAAAHGPDRDAALRLIVRAGQTASTTCRYVGHPADGWLAAEWARRAAERLSDPVLIGFAGFERAHAAAGCGAYTRAHTISDRTAAELSAHMSRDHVPEVLGLLMLTSGYTSYALKRPNEGAQYLAEAASIADRTGETTTFNQWFGPTNVALWRVATQVDGGDPDEAVRIALSTNATLLPSRMRQAMFYLDTSRALARVNRDREAVKYMVTAERMAPQLVHASPFAAETARGLRDRAGGPKLRALCERMGVPA
jgi:transcriptional regulator with XRE-family HTH domain